MLELQRCCRAALLLIVSALYVLLGAACASSRAPAEYPIGIYSPGGVTNLSEIRRAGFSLIASGANKTLLDAAERTGLGVLASPMTSAGREFNAAKARTAIRQFDRHPALWAWYLADEPDMHGIPPQHLIDVHQFMKREGARKPTALVLFQGGNALDYGQITDIVMVDRYPVPWLPLAHFPQHVRMARLGAGPEKPLIAVIQAFDWTLYPDLLRGEKNLRPPTYEELRCMTYGALLRRADGLFYYCFDDGRWRMREHAKTWEAIQKVVAEVREREPLFQAKHEWWPYDHDFADRTRRFNAALEASIAPALLKVEKGTPAVPRGYYVLAVNTTDAEHRYRFRLPGEFEGEINVLGEDRTRPIRKNWVEDEFGPYAVHVYGPIPMEDGR